MLLRMIDERRAMPIPCHWDPSSDLIVAPFWQRACGGRCRIAWSVLAPDTRRQWGRESQRACSAAREACLKCRGGRMAGGGRCLLGFQAPCLLRSRSGEGASLPLVCEDVVGGWGGLCEELVVLAARRFREWRLASRLGLMKRCGLLKEQLESVKRRRKKLLGRGGERAAGGCIRRGSSRGECAVSGLERVTTREIGRRWARWMRMLVARPRWWLCGRWSGRR